MYMYFDGREALNKYMGNDFLFIVFKIFAYLFAINILGATSLMIHHGYFSLYFTNNLQLGLRY